MQSISRKKFLHLLKPRAHDAHKGEFGHVLIIGSDLGYSGAVRLAAEGALRVGAGLVTVATHPHNALTVNSHYPEIMSVGIKSVKDIQALLTKATVVVIGPGLGQKAWGKMCWNKLKFADLPLVVDADALNLLAHEKNKKKLKKENWILTPHQGEAQRLLPKNDGRLRLAQSINNLYGGVTVLKGAGTIICAEGKEAAICKQGNPGMATAGMGDLLSGVIGGLLAQGISLSEAAQLGVCLHAEAGDLAAANGERGMVASDLLPHLQRLSNDF